jgi:hypothetical protein
MNPLVFFKKYLFLIFISLYSFAQAQTQFGLRLAPGISFTQANGNQENYDPTASGGNAAFGGSLGLTVDFSLNQHLSIATGLWYTVKAANIDFNQIKQLYFDDQNGRSFIINYDNAKSRYQLSYLQLPITIKVFTPESSSGIRFYGQGGGTLDLKTAEKALEPDQNLLFQVSEKNNGGKSVYKNTAISLYLGVGLEKKLRSGKGLVAGLSYQRNLNNVMNSLQYLGYYGFTQYQVYPQLLALEMGLKF